MQMHVFWKKKKKEIIEIPATHHKWNHEFFSLKNNNNNNIYGFYAVISLQAKESSLSFHPTNQFLAIRMVT